MGWVGAAASMAGGIMGASSQIQAMKNQKRLSSQNRKLLAYERDFALKRSAFEASRVRQKGKQTIGKQRVAFAKAGISPTSETMLAVMANTEYEYELDAKIIEYDGNIEAWRIDQQRKQIKSDTQRMESSSYLSAFSSLLGGTASAYTGAQASGLLTKSSGLTPKVNRIRAPQTQRLM